MSKEFLQELHRTPKLDRGSVQHDIGRELRSASEVASLPPFLIQGKASIPEAARKMLATLSSQFDSQQGQARSLDKGKVRSAPPSAVENKELGINSVVKLPEDRVNFHKFDLAPKIFPAGTTSTTIDVHRKRVYDTIENEVRELLGSNTGEVLRVNLGDLQSRLMSKGLPSVVSFVSRVDNTSGSSMELRIQFPFNGKQQSVTLDISRSFNREVVTTAKSGGTFETVLHRAIEALPDVDKKLEDISLKLAKAANKSLNAPDPTSSLEQRTSSFLTSLRRDGITVNQSDLHLTLSPDRSVVGTVELRYQKRIIIFKVENSVLNINSATEKTK